MADAEAKPTSRLEAFSDGVFGIAMTLLIIEIKLPELPPHASGRDVMQALVSLWPSYLAFFMSFVTILIMWINHHGLFGLVRGFNRRFQLANGFLLLMVTFVNFPTAVLAAHLEESAANAAVAFYCGTYVLISLSYVLLLGAALPNMPPAVRSGPGSPVPKIRVAYLMGLLVYGVATAVAFVAPYVALSICLATWVLWLLLSYKRHAPHTVAAGDDPDHGRRGG